MNIATFAFPTTIHFGPGVIARLPDEVKSRGMKRPLIVTDAGLVRTAVFERISKLVPGAPVFSQVDPNPTEKNVLDGVAFYKEHACDSIIAAGGGSPLDAAKAIRLKVTHPLPLAEYDDAKDGGKNVTANLPPYIGIATTSGTGSEVGRSAVITIAATNRKTVIFSPHLIASVVLNDPELTLDLPPKLTGGTGMDAFTHNVEAYIAKGYHPICDAIALAGAKLVWENLPAAMERPHDIEARGNMMMASMMGAIAFQKGLGAAHSLAHPLSTEFRMHHGTANALVLPYVLDFNCPVAAERLGHLASQFGGGDIAERVRELNGKAGILPRLRDYGVTAEALPRLADKAFEDQCHTLNPRPCTRDDLLELYRKAL